MSYIYDLSLSFVQHAEMLPNAYRNGIFCSYY